MKEQTETLKQSIKEWVYTFLKLEGDLSEKEILERLPEEIVKQIPYRDPGLGIFFACDPRHNPEPPYCYVYWGKKGFMYTLDSVKSGDISILNCVGGL